jgi:hypothetical protein
MLNAGSSGRGLEDRRLKGIDITYHSPIVRLRLTQWLFVDCTALTSATCVSGHHLSLDNGRAGRSRRVAGSRERYRIVSRKRSSLHTLRPSLPLVILDF